MTRLILCAYSLLAWVFWLGTDSIDIVSQNTPIAPMRSASKSLTAIGRQALCSPAWRIRRNQDDGSMAARTAFSTRPGYRPYDLAGLPRALWTDHVEDVLGGSQT